MSEHFISYEDAQHDLLTAAAYLAERIKSNDGRAEAMTAVVPRFIRLGNVDLAAELANSVEDPFTRDKLLTEVAEKCAQMNDDEYAMQLAESIEELGLKSQALERIAIQKVQNAQTEKALEIATTMAHPDFVYAAAAARAAVDGKRDEVADLLAKVEYSGAKVSALQVMAMHELSAGNKEDCLALLDEAQQTGVDIEHNEERIRTLCEVGNHYVEAGRNDLAIRAYDAAKQEAEQLDNIHRDSFIAGSVMGFLHAGSMDTADRTLDLVTDKTQMSNCLVAFSKYYWDRGEKDEAFEALDEAYQILRSQRDIETRDSRAKFALFGSIAAQYASFERSERAVEIASAIEDDAQRTNSLTQIAALLTARRDDTEARHALNAIIDDSDRAFALAAMSDAKHQIGERPDAVTLLDEAVHLVEAIPQLTARAGVYNEIVTRYLQYSESAKAAEVFETSLRTIAEIRDEGHRAAAVAALSDLTVDPDLELAVEDMRIVEELLSRT